MEQEEKINRLPNPRKGANIISVVTFGYTFPTFVKGYRKDLQEEDIPQHLEAHASSKLGDKLEKAWNQQLNQQNPSLWRAIGRAFGLEFMAYGVMLVVLEIILKVTQTLALAKLITYFTQNDKITEGEAYMYASLVAGSSFLNVLMGHNYMMGIQNFGMKLRVACCSVIYRKALRLSKSALGGTTIGQMVNLISNDVNRCDTAVLQAHNLWVCPIEIIIIVGILYSLVRATSTVGVLFMSLFIPLQMYLGKKTSEFRLKTAMRTDERIRLMNEIISGIQVIKMYTWEKPFGKLVETARRLEIQDIRTASYIRGLLVSFAAFTTRSAIFLTILTYVLTGNSPQAEYVYIVTAFYNILRQAMTVHFPGGIMGISEFRVSVSRIQTFLLHEESCAGYGALSDNGDAKPLEEIINIRVNLQNASARWFSTASEGTLNGINFHACENQLIGIIGPVGSGKTSLLHLILKELPLSSGSLLVEGEISYATQEPWMFAGTVRQNILFGLPMNSKRYQDVIKVCALDEDLDLFPFGDESLVGERGVKLSGGQKARISLARAIYKEADIYLLDDPLSAVDAHVGRQLFEECISTFLKGKCTILVTHQLQYLQKVDYIYLIESKSIAAAGTYQDLKKSQIDFTKYLGENDENETSEEKEVKTKINGSVCAAKAALKEEKEQRSTGHVSSDVYSSYFKAGGSLFIALLILFVFIGTQLLASTADLFLAYWVNLEQLRSEQNYTTNTKEDYFLDLSSEVCTYIYTGVIVFMIVFALARSFSSFSYAMKASTKLHDNMFSNLVMAPMQFFNTNSSGRILNRFSKDTGVADDVLPMIIIDCLQIGLTGIGVTVLVSIVNPWLLIETGLILVLFYLIRVLYLSTSRSVKRLEGTTRSPVFAHLTASLQGLTTIRAFGAQGILQKEFDSHQDMHSAAWHLFLICTRAFGFWLDLICVFYITSVTFSFLIMKNEKYGGNVGLAITQALSLTGLFQWGMRQWSELENQMTSVERIVEYTKVEQEVDLVSKLPTSNWPDQGGIEFKSVSLRYSLTDPYVLQKLCFSIKPKEKIGIVGRTGAGKSSLMYAIFQLTPTEGEILIDNVDVSKIPLHCLRSNISIIPQEPVLFSGTLRKNLDPFDEFTDANLWSALEDVELKHVVNDLPAGLNNKLTEGGSNFSVGQRQLVCLARAILRKNRILVLDEATANVDPRTDVLIQSTIRNKFSECTVLTIAHRLQTVMDSDRILVMQAGQVAEFDHPYLLLENERSILHSLVQQNGQGMAKKLLEVARNGYNSRNNQ